MNIVGKGIAKIDGMSIATGKPVYTDDLAAKEALVVKILRSPHPYAIIEEIDTKRALMVPGVECILTYKDVPNNRFTLAGQSYPEPSPYDRLILDKTVRYVGDEVAIIAAIDEKTALKAMKMIKVKYNVLKPVIDMEKAIDNESISYIFQDDRLIDWLTVGENINLVVKKLYNKKKCDDLCDKYLDLVGIKEYNDYYPQMLSGGLRQRVNIARAFIYPSKFIIMDEPFKSIDMINKEIIMNNFRKILEKEKRTVLFVTHDMDEALLLSDKIYVLGNSPVKIKKVFENKNITKDEIYKLI